MPAVAPLMSMIPAVAGVSVPARLAIPEAEHEYQDYKFIYHEKRDFTVCFRV